MIVRLYFDGLCEPRNPGGWACYGWIAQLDGQPLGHGAGLAREPAEANTNNAAEYAGLIAGLEALQGLPLEVLTVCGDSALVIKQCAGVWACRAPGLIPLRDRVLALAAQLGAAGIEWRWIPKEENTEADLLSWRAYRAARGAGGG